MIQLPTIGQLETLKNYQHPNCLSIYAPHMPMGSTDNPNRIQMKNLLKEARKLLEAQKLDYRQINAILRPIKNLIDSDEFRSERSHSLALFVQKDFFELYELPMEDIEKSVTLSDKFELAQIIKITEDNPSYYVLTLSHNRVQLLHGDQYSIEQLQPANLPVNMKQELNIDIQPNELQTHTVAPASKGKGSEAFHGQYEETQVDKNMLSEFFRRIDHRLHELLKDDSTPLIIGGVEYLLPIYRQVNTHPRLLKGDIKGNLENSSLDYIREKAFALLADE